MDLDQLRAYDQAGYRTLEALTHVRAPRQSTHSSPHAFICTGGRTYWVKRSAQHGLVVELVAARLGAALKVAPTAEVVDVSPAAAPEDGAANHLLGVGVGIEDRGGFNPRELTEFQNEGQVYAPGVVRAEARAAVIVFQTWVGAEDSQVLIDPTTGGVLSIDHGACLPEAPGGVQVVVTDIPGVPATLGKDAPQSALEVVSQVEAFSDDAILRVFAGVPDAPEWNSAAERRLRMAESLSHRKARVREVISVWLQS